MPPIGANWVIHVDQSGYFDAMLVQYGSFNLADDLLDELLPVDSEVDLFLYSVSSFCTILNVHLFAGTVLLQLKLIFIFCELFDCFVD